MIGIRYSVYNDLNLVDRLILFLTRQKMPNLRKNQKNCFFSFRKTDVLASFRNFVVRSIAN